MEILGPSVTLIVGLVAGFIAFQQSLLSRRKLKLDLFDKRYRVYEAAHKFIEKVLSEPEHTDKYLWQFNVGTSDVVFLFGEDIVHYIAEIRKRAVGAQMRERKYRHLPVGEERSRHVDLEHQDVIWLTEQMTNLPLVFAPYLDFKKAL